MNKPVKIFTHLVLLLGAGSRAMAAAPKASDMYISRDLFLSVVLLLAMPFIVYVALRVLSIYLVYFYMRKRAPSFEDADGASFEKRREASPPVTDLQYVEISSFDGVFLDNPLQQRLEKAVTAGQQTWKIYRRSLLAFPTLLLLFFLLTWIIVSISFRTFIATILVIGLDYFLALIFIFLSRSSYKIREMVSLGVVLRRLAALSILNLIFALYSSNRLQIYPLFIVIAVSIGAGSIAWQGYSRIRNQHSRDENIKLLILRVFGADRNTAFLFGPLTLVWRFLGSVITIVDPSYIRYKFSFSSKLSKAILKRFFMAYFRYGIILGSIMSLMILYATGVLANYIPLLLITFHISLSPTIAAFINTLSQLPQEVSEIADSLKEPPSPAVLTILLAPFWALAAPSLVVPIAFSVRGRFISNINQLRLKIEQFSESSSNWSGVHKEFPLYCYDNVWKNAMQLALRECDAVLMDLRGFSSASRGCAYEIQALINQVSLQRVLFLMDPGPSKEFAIEVIQQCWVNRQDSSPNLQLSSPTVKIYTPRNEDERDIPRVLALLIASAKNENGDTYLRITSNEKQYWQESGGKAIFHKWRWRDLYALVPQFLDRVLTNTKYARIVLPLIACFLAIIFLSSFLSIWAAVQKFRKQPTYEAYAEAGGVIITANAVSTSANSVRVALGFTGGPASEALQYGDVKITSAVDKLGASLVPGPSPDQKKLTDVEIPSRSSSMFMEGRRRNGFEVAINLPTTQCNLEEIRDLSGTVTVKISDPSQIIRKDLTKFLPTPEEDQVSDSRLTPLGLISIKSYRDVTLIAEAKSKSDLFVRGFAGGESPTLVQPIRKERLEIPIGTNRRTASPIKHIEIILNQNTVQIPFKFSRVAVKFAEKAPVPNKPAASAYPPISPRPRPMPTASVYTPSYQIPNRPQYVDLTYVSAERYLDGRIRVFIIGRSFEPYCELSPEYNVERDTLHIDLIGKQPAGYFPSTCLASSKLLVIPDPRGKIKRIKFYGRTISHEIAPTVRSISDNNENELFDKIFADIDNKLIDLSNDLKKWRRAPFATEGVRGSRSFQDSSELQILIAIGQLRESLLAFHNASTIQSRYEGMIELIDDAEEISQLSAQLSVPLQFSQNYRDIQWEINQLLLISPR